MSRYIGIILILAGIASGNDSNTFRGTSSRGGGTLELLSPKAAPAEALSLRWTLPVATGQQISSPIIGGGLIYLASTNGTLYCLDPNSGSAFWTFETSATMTATPLFHKGRLYVASQDGTLYVLHAATGELLFTIFHGTAIKGSPLLATDVPIGTETADLLILSFGAPAAELRAYNAITGDYLWSGAAGFRQLSNSTPVYHAEYNRIIVGDSAGFWHCYDASTGTPLWEYRTGSLVAYTSAACEGEYVVLPSAGSNERNVHVLKQTTTPPYYEFHQSVLATPPASATEGLVNKVGATAEGTPDIKQPWTKVVPQVLDTLLELTKAERDEYLDHLAMENGGAYEDLREWLDLQAGDIDPDLNKASLQTGVSYINLSWAAVSSSPAFVDGRVIVSHRGLSGFGTDEFYTVAIDVTPDPAETKVVWGTMVQSYSLSDFSLVASPSVSASTWVYNARGTEIEVRNFSNGELAGSVDVGEGILGGPTLANGYVYVTTDRGKLHCYESANRPPVLPASFAPSEGQNITATDTPTLSWGMTFDPDGEPVATELQIGVGIENSDLELGQSTPIELPPGISSYPLSFVPENSHLFWRIRVRDGHGAESPWSATQDFWVKRDTTPPAAPLSLNTVPLQNSVEVAWEASPSADVTHYLLGWKESTEPSWTEMMITSPLSHTVGGLTNGTPYDFRVVAVDAGENISQELIATATPNAAILVDGVPFSGTVQAALDASAPGATVELGVGTFIENLTLPERVSLRGYSAHHTQIIGTGTGPVIRLEGTYDPTNPASEIAHLSITNGETGIDAGMANAKIHHVVIYFINGDGIRSEAGGKLSALNNTLGQNLGWGITAECDPALTEIRNNLATQNVGGIEAVSGSWVDWNSAWENSPEQNFSPGIVGEGNGSMNTFFLDSAAGDYRVLSGGAIDRADPTDPYAEEPSPNGGRRNRGAFGDTPWAAPSPAIFAAPEEQKGGGRCGALGLEFLLFLGLLRLARRGRRR